nr:hypothetical protein [Tanacetum cinerariifolium]
KFCENGAKAVNWEATGRHVDPAFFAKYSVSALLEQSDYWLEYQGRLTHPMRYDAATDHYVETSWEEAFALIARGGVQPAEGAGAGAFSAPAAPAGNAQQRLGTHEYRVLSSCSGGRHGCDSRHGEVSAGV